MSAPDVDVDPVGATLASVIAYVEHRLALNRRLARKLATRHPNNRGHGADHRADEDETILETLRALPGAS